MTLKNPSVFYYINIPDGDGGRSASDYINISDGFGVFWGANCCFFLRGPPPPPPTTHPHSRATFLALSAQDVGSIEDSTPTETKAFPVY